MKTTPDSPESIAANALLLLLNGSRDDDRSGSRLPSSPSSSSAIDTSRGRRSVADDPLLLLAFVADRHLVYQTKFQSIKRRPRTKVYFVAARREPPPSDGTTTVAAASTVSTASVSSPKKFTSVNEPPAAKKPMAAVKMGTKRVLRAADEIRKLLAGGGSFSESRIREAFGDSPDTSKALRLLLKLHEVKRSGGGGKSNPYSYELGQQHSGVDSS